MEGQNVKASMITISHEDLQELLERAAEIGANTGTLADMQRN